MKPDEQGNRNSQGNLIPASGLPKTQKINMKKILILIVGLTYFVYQPGWAQDIVFPSNKIGVYLFEFQGPVYELDNLTTKESGSEKLSGTVLFYERILSDVFTLGIKYGSGMTRTLEFDIGSSEVTIEETVSYQALEIKSYGTNHRKGGFKPYLAVSYGMLTATSTISTSPESGSIAEDETTAVIPIKAWCIGFDYILWKIAFRMEIGQSNGSRNDLESSDTYRAKYQYDTTTAGVALAYFF